MYTCPEKFSEAAFRNKMKQALRKFWLQWPPRAAALKLARKRVQIDTFKNGNPKMGFEHQCADCHEWFPQEKGKPAVEVDHIVEVGGWSSDIKKWGEDLGNMYDRLLCHVDGLRILCKPCHKIRTNKYREELRK